MLQGRQAEKRPGLQEPDAVSEGFGANRDGSGQDCQHPHVSSFMVANTRLGHQRSNRRDFERLYLENMPED